MPQIWVDERAMRQICLNLLSNALKFTPKGGRITIRVATTPEGGQLLAVKDTGPGIPKEEIPKVLQAFGQGSLAHQTAEGGTGLGLPIVQNLVELHGGTFELLLGAAQGHRSHRRAASPARAAGHAAAAAARPRAAPRGSDRGRSTAEPGQPLGTAAKRGCWSADADRPAAMPASVRTSVIAGCPQMNADCRHDRGRLNSVSSIGDGCPTVRAFRPSRCRLGSPRASGRARMAPGQIKAWKHPASTSA